MKQKVWQPDVETFTLEVGQRMSVAAGVVERFGKLGGELEADLALLQRAVDERVLAPTATVAWQSLGIAFGMILSEALGLEWVMVEDEFGRDPALRADDGTTLLFPLTMISKRIERGEQPDLRALVDTIAKDLDRRSAAKDP